MKQEAPIRSLSDSFFADFDALKAENAQLRERVAALEKQVQVLMHPPPGTRPMVRKRTKR